MSNRLRESLSCKPEAALRATLGMGRVMLATNAHGATHERIGSIEAVLVEGAFVRLSGDAHDAMIEIGPIAAVIADRTGKMKDKALPRLEFQNACGAILFSAICLDGLEPFDAALTPFGAGAPLPAKERQASDPAVLGDADPGAEPFAAAAATKQTVAIALHRDGIVQRWSGVVEAIKPAMGFINVMTPDFHLHLRGGSVARWTRTEQAGEVTLAAETAEGVAIGLRVSGPAAVFAHA